jgi:hypothetical protein
MDEHPWDPAKGIEFRPRFLYIRNVDRRISMNKPTTAIILTGVIVFGLSLGACKSVPSDELKNSIEVTDIDTKWVSKYYQPWPPRLILVPIISFRIKNIGDKPLKHVNFNGIFKFKGDPENLGDNFLAAIRGDAVAPGGSSEIITLKSNFGVEGKNLASFRENVMWKPVEVKIYARSRGSQFVLLGEWNVSRTIDFKEPEPVDIRKDEPKPTS